MHFLNSIVFEELSLVISYQKPCILYCICSVLQGPEFRRNGKKILHQT